MGWGYKNNHESRSVVYRYAEAREPGHWGRWITKTGWMYEGPLVDNHFDIGSISGVYRITTPLGEARIYVFIDLFETRCVFCILKSIQIIKSGSERVNTPTVRMNSIGHAHLMMVIAAYLSCGIEAIGTYYAEQVA